MRLVVVLAFILAISGIRVSAQVNLQTGAPEQNFPLINYVDGKAGLSMGVNLGYSGGNGLLVNDIASNVGTGWNLESGGFITRIQNGEPDDQQAYAIGGVVADDDNAYDIRQMLKNYPNGYLFNPFTNSGCNEGLNYYPVFKENKIYKELNHVAADMEQDKFYFRVNGKSGFFVIGKNQEVKTLGDSRVKITFTMTDMTSQGIRTRINQFTIITEDGIKYTFSEKSLTHICRYKYSTRDAYGDWYPIWGQANDDPYAINRFWGYKLEADERPYIVNSWFLSEMKNPNTNQSISFAYQNVENDLVSAASVNHSRILNSGKPGTEKHNRTGRNRFNMLQNPEVANGYCWNEAALNEFGAGPTTVFYNRSVSLTKRISAINLPNNGQIIFTYSAAPRADLAGDNALEKISYTIGGKLVRAYQFTYGYFFKNTIRPYNYSFAGYESKFARLCLLSLQKAGTGEDDATEPPYLFSYYTGSTQSTDDIVPARNFLAQDHWGYYNGTISGLSLTEDHDFFSNEQTQYFKTVLPRYKNPKNGYAKNGMLKTVTYPTGGTLEYTYEQNRPSQNILPATYEQLAGGVSVSKTTVYDGEDHGKDLISEYSYKTASNLSSRWGDEAPEYYNLTWTEYNRKWLGKVIWNKVGLSYPEAAVSTDILKMAIKIAFGTGIGWGINKAVALLPPPYNVIAEVVVMVVQLIKMILNFTGTSQFHRFTLGNKNNILANALPGLYSMVQVRNNSPTGYNGKIVYEFTDLKDYPALVPKLKWPFIQNQRLASWAYGLPKKVSVYDKDDLLVKETENSYNYLVYKNADPNNQSCKCATPNKRDIKGKDWEDYEAASFTWNQVEWMIPQPYYIYTGRTDLAGTAQREYTNGQLYYSNVSSTLTDPMTLLQKGKILLKDGTSLVLQITYYPTDYNIANSAMEKMVQMNAIHTPISTETWLIKNGVSSLLDATVTQYSVYQFGSRSEVKPYKIWRLKSRTPVASSVIGMHDPTVLIRQPSLFHLQSVMTYDNDGNLVQADTEQNPTSFVNDYSSRSVVANVANASYADVSYTSFEADGKGGWNFNTAFINNTGGATGANAFKLGLNPGGQTATITRTGLDAGKKYVITCWMKNIEPAYVNINGQPGEVTYWTEEWLLVRHEVTGVTQVVIEGDAVLDELRLHPLGALMNTATYKEGIGKTADCDANNRILHYEYDALGRLKLVRDQNRNIIKTYEYNYKRP